MTSFPNFVTLVSPPGWQSGGILRNERFWQFSQRVGRLPSSPNEWPFLMIFPELSHRQEVVARFSANYGTGMVDGTALPCSEKKFPLWYAVRFIVVYPCLLRTTPTMLISYPFPLLEAVTLLVAAWCQPVGWRSGRQVDRHGHVPSPDEDRMVARWNIIHQAQRRRSRCRQQHEGE
jgi:hypothetical protein